MLNIKEIALKVTMDTGLYLDGANQSEPFYVVKPEEIVEFAEALIAEIAKQNEPVAYATTSEDGDMAMLFFDDGEARKYSGDDAPIKLYTIPPTAEQIANDTAEAIAAYFRQQPYVEHFGDNIAEAIRNGAWKEFKK